MATIEEVAVSLGSEISQEYPARGRRARQGRPHPLRGARLHRARRAGRRRRRDARRRRRGSPVPRPTRSSSRSPRRATRPRPAASRSCSDRAPRSRSPRPSRPPSRRSSRSSRPSTRLSATTASPSSSTSSPAARRSSARSASSWTSRRSPHPDDAVIAELRDDLGKKVQHAVKRGVVVTFVTQPLQRVPEGVQHITREHLVATEVLADGEHALLAGPASRRAGSPTTRS